MAQMDLRYAMGEFSMAVMQKVEVLPNVDQGFKNFFSEGTSVTRGIKLFVERQGRPIAIDVAVGEKGITTRRDKSTQKNYIPAYFDYKFNYSALEEYEQIMGQDNSIVDTGIFNELVENTARGVQENADRLERRREYQRAEALLTGFVTMKNGDTLDFKRKAASLVDYSTDFGWDVDTNSPDIILRQGAEFLITEGKVSATTPFNIIGGANALQALKDNPIFQGYADNRRYTEVMFDTGVGTNDLTPHGTIKAGNFRFNLWGYTGYYTDPDTGVETPYMDTDKIIILPDTQVFSMRFCGVKGWQGNPYGTTAFPKLQNTKVYSYEVRDVEGCAVELGLRSSFAAVLDKVDNVFTAKVTNTGGQG